MKGKIQTVLGLIDPDDLGVTLTHEHLLIDMVIYYLEPSGAGERTIARGPVTTENLFWIHNNQFSNQDNLQVMDEAVSIEEVSHYKNEGGNSLVELSNRNFGRDPLGLARISRATGLNIIMGSGYHIAAAQGPDYDRKTEDDIEQEFITDIQLGVGDTGIHSGIMGELGCSWPLEEREKKCLRAAARAQQKTGACMSIHPGRSEKSPMEIIRLLEDAGADINRVIMGHMDRILHSPKVRREIVSTGCCVEYDAFGAHIFNPIAWGALPRPCDRERIEQIIEFIRDGHLNQILVSQDICMKTKLTRYGGFGYAHILRNIVPHMLNMGMTREQITTILVDNPRRLLQIV